jgi:hypothetical protein
MDSGYGILGAVLAGYLVFILLALVVGILTLIGMYKLYEKAGESGWKAIIPFYNNIVLSKIVSGDNKLGIYWIAAYVMYYIFYTAGSVSSIISSMLTSMNSGSSYHLPAARILMLLVSMVFSIVLMVVSGILNYKLGKAFGKSDGWCVAMIFLSGILVIAMGFDKNLRYVGPNGVPSDQYVPDNYNNNNNYYNNY